MSRPRPQLRTQALDFQPIRDELEVPRAFPAQVEGAALAARQLAQLPGADATDVELVTIDPPGSLDLDQALHVVRRGDGFRVHYAIADLAAFIRPDDPLDQEARLRGETLYSPDIRTPLHPTSLGEDAASLLPGQIRPALLWRIDLDAEGRQVDVDLRRAMVRSRSRLDYQGLQAAIDAGQGPEATSALAEVGRLRSAIADERGAIELGTPDQEVERIGDQWKLVRREPLAVESWNAEISLLTGMAAASMMLSAGVGLLRTLPPAPERTVQQLRHAARALNVAWPPAESPAQLIRSLDPSIPAHAALLEEAAHLLRGAGYTALDPRGYADDQHANRPHEADRAEQQWSHAGVGAPYAHVTAPIRRLGDRFTSEVCVALVAGSEVPSWALEALPDLPELLSTSSSRAHRLDRECIDLTEAWLLADRVGESFPAAVVDSGEHGATVVIEDPPVRAPCSGTPEIGTRISARLVLADVGSRAVRFEPA